MKKTIALIITLTIIVLHLPTTKVLADTEVWDIYVTQIDKKSELETEEAVTLYTGDIQNITHTDIASEGNTYLLVKLYVNKTKTDNTVFNIEGASITVGSETIEQVDNGFLSKHNMTPFTKNDIRFGESEGWIVFEVSDNTSTTNATLTLNGAKVDLEVREVEADTTLSNIATTESIMDTQWEIEKQLIADYNQGSYDLENPYVILDPYNWAPLSALALFKSEKPARVSVEVQGKDEYSTITHDFTEFNTFHQVPIVGLYADYVNTVTLTLNYQDGSTEDSVIEVKTEALIDSNDLAEVELVYSNPELMQDGLTFFLPRTKRYMAIDCYGETRWIINLISSKFEPMIDGNILINNGTILYEMDFIGKIYNSYRDPKSIHHDIHELPNKNILTTSNHNVYVEDRVIEFDKETGEIVNDIDLKNILDVNRFNVNDDLDWFHNNALWFDESDNTLILSGRDQGVIKISYPEGELIWFLTLDEQLDGIEDKVLVPVDRDNYKAPVGQHAPMILPDYDNNPDTLDILLFDNNSGSTGVPNHPNKALYSRAVHYRINEKDLTVEEIWSFGEELGKDYYSSIISDADLLHNENILTTFGWRNSTFIQGEDGSRLFIIATIIEVNRDKEVILEFDVLSNDGVYRSERLPIYPENWNFSLLTQKGELKARNNYETMQTEVEFVDISL